MSPWLHRLISSLLCALDEAGFCGCLQCVLDPVYMQTTRSFGNEREGEKKGKSRYLSLFSSARPGLEFGCVPLLKVTAPARQLPLYNSPQVLLSVECTEEKKIVFSLPGTGFS